MSSKKTMKKTALLFVLFSLLSSCSQNEKDRCYQCYFGKMYLSSCSISYDEIDSLSIQDNLTDSSITYYGNVYSLFTEKEKNDFYADSTMKFTEDEISKIKKYSGDDLIEYFTIQIPSGYKAIKRNNVQGYTKNDTNLVLLTDNFYYYSTRKNLLYCEINLEKDTKNTSESVFSFYFVLSDVFKEQLSSSSIRLIYHEYDVLEDNKETVN